MLAELNHSLNDPFLDENNKTFLLKYFFKSKTSNNILK